MWRPCSLRGCRRRRQQPAPVNIRCCHVGEPRAPTPGNLALRPAVGQPLLVRAITDLGRRPEFVLNSFRDALALPGPGLGVHPLQLGLVRLGPFTLGRVPAPQQLDAVSATYTPTDGSHRASSGSATVTVRRRAATVQVSCSPSSTSALQPRTTCTVTVGDGSPGNASAPAGIVRFTSDDRGTDIDPTSCTLTAATATTATCSVAVRPSLTLLGTRSDTSLPPTPPAEPMPRSTPLARAARRLRPADSSGNRPAGKDRWCGRRRPQLAPAPPARRRRGEMHAHAGLDGFGRPVSVAARAEPGERPVCGR